MDRPRFYTPSSIPRFLSEREEVRLRDIIDRVGFEQILIDHLLTIEEVMLHLHDFGLIDLDPYEVEND